VGTGVFCFVFSLSSLFFFFFASFCFVLLQEELGKGWALSCVVSKERVVTEHRGRGKRGNGSNMEALSGTAWCSSKPQQAVWRREDALGWVDKEDSANV